MAKRKGSPASRAGTSSQRESESKPSQKGMEDECDQLRREICALEATHDNLVVRYRPLFREDSREPKRAKLEEELEQVQQNLRTKREHLKLKEAEYTQSIQRLRKLPPEVWEKILDELDENDLFPLALSCKNFRQKQKELVARTRKKKNGSKRGRPRRALRTNLRRKLDEGQPASLEYLQFCSEEKLLSGEGWKKTKYIKCLAAYHGYLPLLQELQGPSWTNDYYDERIARAAGKSLSHSIFYLFCFGF